MSEFTEGYIGAVRRELLAEGTSRTDGLELSFDSQIEELQQLSEHYKAPNAIRIFGGIFFSRCQKELEQLLRVARISEAERKALNIVNIYKHKANFTDDAAPAYAEAV